MTVWPPGHFPVSGSLTAPQEHPQNTEQEADNGHLPSSLILRGEGFSVTHTSVCLRFGAVRACLQGDGDRMVGTAQGAPQPQGRRPAGRTR